MPWRPDEVRVGLKQIDPALLSAIDTVYLVVETKVISVWP